MDATPYLPGSAAAANAGMLSHSDISGNDFDFSIKFNTPPDNDGAPTDHIDGAPTGNRTTQFPDLDNFMMPQQEQPSGLSPGGSLVDIDAFLSDSLTPAPPTKTHPGLALPVPNQSGVLPVNYEAVNGFYPTAENPYPPRQNFTSANPWPQPSQLDNRYPNGFVQHQNIWNNHIGQVPQPNRFPDNTPRLLYGVAQPDWNYPPITGRSVSSANYDSGSETLDNENNSDVNPGDKISYVRGDKARQLNIADPSKFYTKPVELPLPWDFGDTTFSYDARGHLTSGLTFNADQLRNYFQYCPRQLRLWLQHHPAQCNARINGRDHSCRWSECPVPSKNIGPGWHRVVFDEYSKLTTNGDKDPFHIAGAMHLWCFEQCFDAAEYWRANVLRADIRALPREHRNPMALNRHPDANIVLQSLVPWIDRQLEIGPQVMPRLHEESLSFALSSHHLTCQSVTRQMTRDKRFNNKLTKVKKTADCHKGNLGLWVSENNKEREQKRLEKQITKEMMLAHGIPTNSNIFVNNIAARMAQGANVEAISAPSLQLLAQATYPEDRQLMPPPPAPAPGADVSSGPDVRGNELVDKKRARNDGEDDDSDSDCDCSPDAGDEFASPRTYKRAHKRVRIGGGEEAEEGLLKFKEMLKRRAGELGCRRRTYCSGDNPRRLQRGILA
ncbi:hypothetical protein EDB80DRAFT_807965 [Ilyonectria destructans]|nr:hypothetical protein EDB80DRAFT_807965 [Ilyonectria destructans]